MTFAFFSNFLNHHQLPFCEAMAAQPGVDFTFVATQPFDETAVSKGYEDMNRTYPFVLRAYDSPQEDARAQELCLSADVVLFGSAPPAMLEPRLAANRLVLRYSERPFKPLYVKKTDVREVAYLYSTHTRWRAKNCWMLCAGSGAPGDFRWLHAYPHKLLRWGYFPRQSALSFAELAAKKQQNAVPHILWAGRLIGWKHPEAAVEAAQVLKLHDVPFSLEIIGEGPLGASLEQKIAQAGLEDLVHLRGALPFDEVRAAMEQADIFLFTSDANEGWGAVLNEAMASGCAVIANRAAGASEWLVKEGKSGFLYQDGDLRALAGRTIRFCRDAPLRAACAHAAFDTVADAWNAPEAARRLAALCGALLAGEAPQLPPDGPCSKAPVL